VHGLQYAPGERRDRPTAYYGPQSGVAAAVRHHPLRRAGAAQGLRIGVLGLGVGTVAALAERGDRVRFYEISPAVARLARGEGGYFSFLADSPAKIEVVLGDARVQLEDERRRGREPPFDLLVLDAFSSGAVPAHLLTREAFALYVASLQAPDGVLAINASNRDLDLPRVVWRQARELGLHGVTIDTPADPDGESWHSLWILLSRDPAAFDDPGIAVLATAAPADTADFPLWTDDHSSLLPLLRTGSE
jgi:SAM-dependent methyltransferase